MHVVEATQLETSVFERFSWAASHLLTACAYHQSGEHWRMSFPSLSKALEEALAPHLLSAYEANLENIDGIDGPEKLIFELLKNFGALKAQLWKLKAGSLQEFLIKRLLSFSLLGHRMNQQHALPEHMPRLPRPPEKSGHWAVLFTIPGAIRSTVNRSVGS